jgi:hypothetical protein
MALHNYQIGEVIYVNSSDIATIYMAADYGAPSAEDMTVDELLKIVNKKLIKREKKNDI